MTAIVFTPVFTCSSPSIVSIATPLGEARGRPCGTDPHRVGRSAASRYDAWPDGTWRGLAKIVDYMAGRNFQK
jgi:hypothetical protein